MKRYLTFILLLIFLLFPACSDDNYLNDKVKAVELSDAFNAEFSLLNLDEKPVTHETLKGKISIVYLGFTHCESICAASLSEMSYALDDMGKYVKRINPVFVGVDPNGGDTAQTMRDFLAFDKRIMGFYGSTKQTEFLVKNLRAYVKTKKQDNALGYTLDHTSFYYILDKNAKPIYIIQDYDDVSNLAKFLIKLIKKTK